MSTHGRREGNITLFFLLLAFVMLGALSYSLYIGRSVQEKIELANAADLTALSMANHTAAGLNMIAVNNLAVAGNLHVAAAVPFFGRYWATARALLVKSPGDFGEVAKLLFEDQAETSVFANVFNSTRAIPGLLMKAAAGNTQLNETLVATWFPQALVRGAQYGRTNAPGAIVLPADVLAPAATGTAETSQVPFAIQRLSQTATGDAFCHSINASANINDRNSSILWMEGLLRSIGVQIDFGVFKTFESFINNVFDKARVALKAFEVALKALLGGWACGALAGAPGPIKTVCKRLDTVAELIRALANPPMPAFAECGLAHEANFQKQADSFTEDYPESPTIGFTFIDVGTKEELDAFEGSVDHAVLLAKPLFLKKKEIPETGCPEGWSFKNAAGESRCDALIGGLDTKNPALSSLLSRTQWALAEAKAEYSPGAGDPDHAALTRLRRPEDEAKIISSRRMQLFWPAWRGQNAPTKALENVLKFLGSRDS